MNDNRVRHPPHASPQRFWQRREHVIAAPPRYREGGYIGALVMAVLVFLVAWLLNGLTTAWGSRPLFLWLLSGVNRLLDNDIAITAGLLWGLGWIAHIGISLVERHLWKSQRRIFYALSVPCNFWDMLTAALAIKLFFFGSLVGGTLGANILYTLLGFALSVCELPLVIAVHLLYYAIRERKA